jgi:hypothetical protein
MWCIVSSNVRPFAEFKDTDSFTDFSNAVMGEAVRPLLPSSWYFNISLHVLHIIYLSIVPHY